MFTLNSNVDLTAEELLSYAQSLSAKEGSIREKLLHWEFGPLMEMRFDPKAQNYLFSDEDVPFHWDGAFHKEPQLLLFHCLESEGEGGETLFTNTELIWESLSDVEKRECEGVTLVYETKKLAHYGGKITVPLVQKHPLTGKTILRMAEAVETELNPVSLTIQGAQDPADFNSRMKEKLYDPKFMTEHVWAKGDLLVCDNFTYLHGRRPLRQNMKRSFRRLQIL